jgi:hypothetical protein
VIHIKSQAINRNSKEIYASARASKGKALTLWDMTKDLIEL